MFFGNRPFATFYFKDSFHNGYAIFNLESTNHVHVGDEFNWLFLKGKFNSVFFYIESISHEHKNGRVNTSINLKSGFYNSYRELLLYKAKFLDLIEFDEILNLSDYE